MNNLIKIDFTKPQALDLDKKIDLRDLFDELVVQGGIKEKSNYTTWARQKLKDFQEGKDFFQKTEESTGGRPSIQHIVPISTALSVAANGHKKPGHDLRNFLVECLRLAQKVAPQSVEQMIQDQPFSVMRALMDRAERAEIERDEANNKAQLYLVKADLAQSQVKIQQDNAASSASAYSLTGHDIYSQYQTIRTEVDLWWPGAGIKDKGKYKNPGAWTTLYLKKVWGVSVKVKEYGQGGMRSLYDRSVIEKVMVNIIKADG